MIFFVNVPHIGENHLYKWAFVVEATNAEEAKRYVARILATRDSIQYGYPPCMQEEDKGDYDTPEKAKEATSRAIREMIDGGYGAMAGKLQAVPLDLPKEGEAVAFPLHYTGTDGFEELELKAFTIRVPDGFKFNGSEIPFEEES